MLALTWYEWFKTLHVLAAVIWVGGGTTLVVYALLTMRQNDPAEMASFARKAGLIGERFYAPMSFIVLALGFGLMENSASPWTYDQFFVIFALAGWAASTLIGVLFLGPEAKKLGKLMPTRPPDDPEIQYRIRRILITARIDVVLLLAIVFVMTAKPFL
ncbi:MAG TPA: DUF2269 family protein [Gaiellaceae bacterium]|nr:DUF2269 family protein [Gaiellaceae bacterium]